MPIKIQSEQNQAGVVVVLSGALTAKEVIATNKEVSRCLECVFQLWDFTAVNQFNALPEEMHKISSQDQSIPENANLSMSALVGSKLDFQGLDEVYHIFSDKWVGRRRNFISRTFESIDEANEWVHC